MYGAIELDDIVEYDKYVHGNIYEHAIKTNSYCGSATNIVIILLMLFTILVILAMLVIELILIFSS